MAMEMKPMAGVVKLDMPPPPAILPEESRRSAVAAAPILSEVVVMGLRNSENAEPAATPISRYAPGTQLQAGPGVPAWGYNSYGKGRAGPGEPGGARTIAEFRPVPLAPY